MEKTNELRHPQPPRRNATPTFRRYTEDTPTNETMNIRKGFVWLSQDGEFLAFYPTSGFGVSNFGHHFVSDINKASVELELPTAIEKLNIKLIKVPAFIKRIVQLGEV